MKRTEKAFVCLSTAQASPGGDQQPSVGSFRGLTDLDTTAACGPGNLVGIKLNPLEYP